MAEFIRPPVNNSINITEEIAHGNLLVFNLSGMDREDVQRFSNLVRPISMTMKQSCVFVPFFSDACADADPGIRAVFMTWRRRGCSPLPPSRITVTFSVTPLPRESVCI